jgi:uncharacterized membrane protein YfcA
MVGFGFPALATPAMVLFMDGRTVIGMLILPNFVMDAIQTFRNPGLIDTIKRQAVLSFFSIIGTFMGTWFLVNLSPRTFVLILGAFVLTFVTVNLSKVSFKVAPRWERLCSPFVGLVAGIIGGVTNVPGLPLVLYFYALGMQKAEFVRSVAMTFMIMKGAQFVAAIHFGLMDGRIFGLSVVATILALGTFWLGLKAQDRVDQAAFNKVVLGLLAVIGSWMLIRALRV